MTVQRVLCVGNCAFDQSQLQRLFPDSVSVESADSTAAALAQAAGCHLVLVNRILDRTGESGLELIDGLRQQHPAVPVMLISNYPDAQQQAEQAGAMPGFGKAQLNDPSLEARLAALLPEHNA